MMKMMLLAAAGMMVAVSAPALAQRHGNSGHSTWSHSTRNHSWSYDTRNCPPGLARKNNGCLPPGIARKRYNVGQHYSTRYGSRWSYSQIPYDLRRQYSLSSRDRYYYRDGYLYRVNPRTLVVEQVLNALLRP